MDLLKVGISAGSPAEALFDLGGECCHLLVDLTELRRLRQEDRQRLPQFDDKEAARRVHGRRARVVDPRVGRQLLLQQLHQPGVHFLALLQQLQLLALAPPPLHGRHQFSGLILILESQRSNSNLFITVLLNRLD